MLSFLRKLWSLKKTLGTFLNLSSLHLRKFFLFQIFLLKYIEGITCSSLRHQILKWTMYVGRKQKFSKKIDSQKIQFLRIKKNKSLEFFLKIKTCSNKFSLRTFFLFKSVENFQKNWLRSLFRHMLRRKCFYAVKRKKLRAHSYASDFLIHCLTTFHMSYHTSLYDVIRELVPDNNHGHSVLINSSLRHARN